MEKIQIPSKNTAVLAAVREALETLAVRQTVFVERLAETHRLDPRALGVILGTCVYGREKNVPVFTVVDGSVSQAPPTVYLSLEMRTQLAFSGEQRTPAPA